MHANGIAKAQVRNVTVWEIDKGQNGCGVALRILRDLNSDEWANMGEQSRRDTLRRCCVAFTNPGDQLSRFPREQSMHALKLIWISDMGLNELPENSKGKFTRSFWYEVLCSCHGAFIGRCFLSSDVYFGLGPAGTQKGDVLYIFLGCRVPIIIRSEPCTSTKAQWWRIVGPAIIPGLMHGEAI